MSLISLSLVWTLVWTAWILSFVESGDPNQSELDNDLIQEVIDEMLQYNSNHPEIQDLDLDFLDLFEDQMGDGSMAPMRPFTETAPSAILTPPLVQPQPQTHTPPLLQPQPQPITQCSDWLQMQMFLMQTPAQPQTMMIVPATTPSHHFFQNQMLSTAPVHTASQQVPMLMGGGVITVGTGGAVKEDKRRKTHSINEKRYRSSINDKIQELRDLLNIDPKVSKSGVLQETIDYIESLQQENLALKRANQNNTSWSYNPPVNPQIEEFEEFRHSNEHLTTRARSPRETEGTFENLEFSKRLEQILDDIFDEAELLAFVDNGGVNNGEHDGSDSQVITLPAEEVLQEVMVGTESRHEPDNITRPSHGPSSEEGTHTSLATNHLAPGPSPQCTGGQGVKRRRLPEEDEVDDSPSTRRLRTSENNEQDFNEERLTARSDSLVHASDQLSFSNSERLFSLAGQPPSYHQQQHNEALGHATEFWRICHEQLYNEFRQVQQSMSNILEDVREQRVEQGLVLNALLVMNEQLNLIQRMLMELYSRMMRRP